MTRNENGGPLWPPGDCGPAGPVGSGAAPAVAGTILDYDPQPTTEPEKMQAEGWDLHARDFDTIPPVYRQRSRPFDSLGSGILSRGCDYPSPAEARAEREIRKRRKLLIRAGLWDPADTGFFQIDAFSCEVARERIAAGWDTRRGRGGGEP